MKRILTAVCALALLMAGCTPALAAEAPRLSAPPTQEPERSCYYPIKVDEYTAGPLDELRIDKVYQLSLGDDPSGIPTEDFTRNGRLYYLLDMVRKDEVGVDTQAHTETVTLASDTDKMDATRTYPNLSRADVSLIPKSINDKGRTLNLADVQWSSAESTDGEGGVVTHYTATASYSGSATSRYATGYTVTANYTGEVSKTDCQIVTYTATFGSAEAPEESKKPAAADPSASDDPDQPSVPFSWAEVKTPLMTGGMVLILIIGGTFALKKIRERR